MNRKEHMGKHSTLYSAKELKDGPKAYSKKHDMAKKMKKDNKILDMIHGAMANKGRK